MSTVMALRERHKETFKAVHGVGLGIASFFVKAATAALRAFPPLNAEIQGDEIVYKSFYDVGIAVGAEGWLWCRAPQRRHPGVLGHRQGIRDFAKRAQEDADLETWPAAPLRSPTVACSIAAEHSDPEPPQVGILACTRSRPPVAVQGQVVVRPMMYIALSYDHRIVAAGRRCVPGEDQGARRGPGQLLLRTK